MNKFLDDGQRASLRSVHRLERDGKIRDRIKAVLMADHGRSISDIADFLLVDEETVRRHLRDYLDRDSTSSGSGGSNGKLSPEQSKRLREVFGESDVMGAAWAVAKTWELFKIGFSISGMTKWLKNNDFSWKKCDGCPAKADPEAQARIYREISPS